METSSGVSAFFLLSITPFEQVQFDCLPRFLINTKRLAGHGLSHYDTLEVTWRKSFNCHVNVALYPDIEYIVNAVDKQDWTVRQGRQSTIQMSTIIRTHNNNVLNSSLLMVVN